MFGKTLTLQFKQWWYRTALGLRDPHSRDFDAANSELYRKLGDTFVELGQWENALNAYLGTNAPSNRHPSERDRKKLRELALNLLDRSDEDAAFAAFLRAIELDPTRDWVEFYPFWQSIESKPVPWGERVVEVLRRLAAEYPDERHTSLNVAEALTRMGKVQDARPWYRTASEQRLRVERPHLDFSAFTQPTRPEFTIVGVMKGGTSSLSHYFSQHPQILPSARKEIDFWSWKYHRGLDWFLAHFPPHPEFERFIAGDASPTYFQHRQAPERLFEAFPQMKILVLLRNPVDRTVSHYYHRHRSGFESRPLADAIRANIQQIERGEIHPDKLDNPVASSLYVFPLQRWTNQFPSEQIRILFSEELFENCHQTLDRIWTFLDLPPHTLDVAEIRNSGEYPPIDDAVRRELSDFFRPYNRQLEDLLDRPTPWNV
ncbi:MAG: sulfotransferase domain-containing protein [Cyanobacteria bacterium SID2]|nr:sulfotransferase domain-containing protein [Cyanobacteria bacterium SID2]